MKFNKHLKQSKRFPSILLFILLSLGSTALASNSKYLAAYGYFFRANYDSAITGFNRLIELEPEQESKVYLARGICYFHLKDYQPALQDLMRSNNSPNSETFIYLAKLHTQTKDYQMAFKCLYQAIELDPLAFSVIKKDTNLQKLRNKDEWFDLLQADNSAEKELIEEASYLCRRGESGKAIILLQEKISTVESKALIHAELGNIFLNRKEYALATMELKKANDINPETIHYKMQYANLLSLNNEIEKALEMYSKVLEQEPENFEAYLNRATLSISLKQYTKAKEDLEIYLEYFDRPARAEFLLAETNYQLGETLVALKQINKVLEFDQSQARYFKLRGNLYLKSGTYKYAASDYSMALDLDPRDGDTYLQYGNVHKKMNNKKKACYAWKKAVQYGEKKAIEFLNKYCTE